MEEKGREGGRGYGRGICAVVNFLKKPCSSRFRDIDENPHPSTSTHRCLMPRSGGTRQNFWTKLIPQKLDGWGYCKVKIA